MNIPSIEGLSTDEVLTLVYCRHFKQYVAMLDGYRMGKCPFCDPIDERNKVLREAGGWRLWANPFPVPHSRFHFIMAPRLHRPPRTRVSPDDFQAIGELFEWAREEYRLTGGGLVMRFGSPRESTGTVLHLHANIIVPDLTGPVEAPLAKSLEKIAAQVARMHVYEKLRLGARPEELTPEEFALVEGRL